MRRGRGRSWGRFGSGGASVGAYACSGSPDPTVVRFVVRALVAAGLGPPQSHRPPPWGIRRSVRAGGNGCANRIPAKDEFVADPCLTPGRVARSRVSLERTGEALSRTGIVARHQRHGRGYRHPSQDHRTPTPSCRGKFHPHLLPAMPAPPLGCHSLTFFLVVHSRSHSSTGRLRCRPRQTSRGLRGAKRFAASGSLGLESLRPWLPPPLPSPTPRPPWIPPNQFALMSHSDLGIGGAVSFAPPPPAPTRSCPRLPIPIGSSEGAEESVTLPR